MQVSTQHFFIKRAIYYLCVSIANSGKIKLNYMNLVFVRLPKFVKPLEECESLQDKLLYSLCHAHEHNEQPGLLKGNVFDRLFTLIKISNFSQMEQDEYIRRAMFRADLREQLRCAEDMGWEKCEKEIFTLLRQGYSLDEVEKMIKRTANITKLPEEQVMALRG